MTRVDSRIEPFLTKIDTALDDPYRKVVIDTVGDDGQWLIALGHVEPRIYACLAIAFLANEYGLSTVDWMVDDFISMDDIVGQVEHRWAVYEYKEEYSETHLKWGGVYPTTVGAFPVTIFDQEL